MSVKASDSAIQTFSGRFVDVFDPDPDSIEIGDIAHALSIQPRYSGHTRFHYSVAQHSMMVAMLAEPADRLYGLLHDATEAYLIDIPRPIKKHHRFAVYEEIEAGLMAVIAAKFGLPDAMPPSVKRADDLAMFAEAHTLFASGYRNWPAIWKRPASDEEIENLSRHVERRPMEEVESVFLGMFANLTGGTLWPSPS